MDEGGLGRVELEVLIVKLSGIGKLKVVFYLSY